MPFLRLLCLLALAFSLEAQTAVFPSAVVTDSQLMRLANRVQSPATVAVPSNATVVHVASGTRFQAPGLVTIDQEIMEVCSIAGNDLTIGRSSCPNVDGRGFDNTSAASHLINAPVSMYVDAWHHMAVTAELKAIETALGANLGNITALTSVAGKAADYNFTPQIPGGALIVGNTAVNLTPVPLGVNGTDNQHSLYVSGGIGTAEACLITGGTGVGGSNGQINLACANAHSGAFAISSASAGIREAAQSLGMVGTVSVGQGGSDIFETLVLPTTIRLVGQGEGPNGTRLVCSAAANPCVNFADAYIANATGMGGLSGLRLTGPGNGSGTTGLWIGGDPNSVFSPSVWQGNYVRVYDVVVTGFFTALEHRRGNFCSYVNSNFDGGTYALYIPSDTNGEMQPTEFLNSVLTTSNPAGAAVKMDNNGFGTVHVHFSGGQVSGTITGVEVGWDSQGTHYEPNTVETPIVDITSTHLSRIYITGGVISARGTTLAAAFNLSGAGVYYLHLRDLWFLPGTGLTIGTMVNFGPATPSAVVLGDLAIANINVAAAGVISRLYTISPESVVTSALSITEPLTYFATGVTVGATTTFPQSNYPIAQPVFLVGGTLGGSGITAVAGLTSGVSGVLRTSSAQTFTLGATIGNTITLTASLPYTYFYDGTKIWVH